MALTVAEAPAYQLIDTLAKKAIKTLVTVGLAK